MQTRIRAATVRDAPGVARVHADSWQASYGGLLPHRYLARLSGPTLVDQWQRRLWAWRSRDAWVADRGGRIVGFSTIGEPDDDEALDGFAGEVNMLYVSPELTGRGIGKRLLEQSLAVLARRGYYWVIIWVLAGNGRARRFYEREGLRLDGEARHDIFAGRTVPVLRYAKALNPVIDFGSLRSGGRVTGAGG